MKRILSSLIAAAFVVSMAGVAGATSKSHGHMMMGHPTKMAKCAKGKTWVHGYTKKNGTKVKGYCR